MTPELRGLIATLQRGENRATPIGLAAPVRRGKGHRNKNQDQSPGLMSMPVSITIPADGAQKTPNTSAGSVGDRPLNDDIDSSTHRCRRRALEDINSVNSNSSSWGLPLPLRVSGKGTSQRLALIWRKIIEKGCELPSLERMREHGAYVRMAVVNAKAMKARNEYAALIERRLADFPSKEEIGVEIEDLKGKLAAAGTEKVAIQNDLEAMKEKHMREIEGRDAAARRECHLAHRSLAREYDAVLAVVRDKLQKKKKETAAEIRLQEVRARIEALTEYIEGGYELEEELECLKGQ
ncbi:hypothetical protein F2Q70_00039226 [Brassica cretica]|nr:hypothetical protein F2Q70_00039226 [Brassica cretica]